MNGNIPDLRHLKGKRLPDSRQAVEPRDCILYALGIGIGMNPLDESDLAFVDETRLRVVPTMANILADSGGHWLRSLDPGLDWRQAVHGEQSLQIHAPLHAPVRLRAESRIIDVVDKGPGRGALLQLQRDIYNEEGQTHLATVVQTAFCRANGGFGGEPGRAPAAWEEPGRPPDHSLVLPTSPQQALIYRLNGDDHPLHIDPAQARAAGFPRPILHGMATFGLVGHALNKVLCAGEPGRVRSLSGRFSAPVYPGDAVCVNIWVMEEGLAWYSASTAQDARTVLTRGVFCFSG